MMEGDLQASVLPIQRAMPNSPVYSVGSIPSALREWVQGIAEGDKRKKQG